MKLGTFCKQSRASISEHTKAISKHTTAVALHAGSPRTNLILKGSERIGGVKIQNPAEPLLVSTDNISRLLQGREASCPNSREDVPK